MTAAPPTTRATGPRTPEGKARSALNALRHGKRSRLVKLAREAARARRKYHADPTAAALAEWSEAQQRYAQAREDLLRRRPDLRRPAVVRSSSMCAPRM